MRLFTSIAPIHLSLGLIILILAQCPYLSNSMRILHINASNQDLSHDTSDTLNESPLIDNDSVMVVLESGVRRTFNKTRSIDVRHAREGVVSYWGGEDGTDGSTLNFCREGSGMVVGSIVDMAGDAVTQFRVDADGTPSLTKVTNTSDFPDEADPIEIDYDRKFHVSVEKKDRAQRIGASDMRSRRVIKKYNEETTKPHIRSNRQLHDDSGGNLDVMVVWTKKAECRAAERDTKCSVDAYTTSNMKALINLAVQETNTAYQRSGIESELNLVHAYRDENYLEVDFTSALTHIRETSDGFLDDVHLKRSEYGADIVVMIIDHPQYCGMAFLGPQKSRMFSVTAWNCMTGYFTFGHEIAQNLGCKQDRGTMNECTGRNFNYGYRDPNARFRSILAKNCRSSQCDDNNGSSCTRVQMFSQPEVPFNKNPIGNSQNDIARQINEVKHIVAGYFPHSHSCLANSDCDDYNPCTENVCEEGTCKFTNPNGLVAVDIHVTPDDYPVETSWTLNTTCTISQAVASSSANALDGTGGIICLPDEQYIFSIYDSWGDGMCCGYGVGSYFVAYGGSIVASGGTFGKVESTTFGSCPKIMVPSSGPSLYPTSHPSSLPTIGPSATLTKMPTNTPSTSLPTSAPTRVPTFSPIGNRASITTKTTLEPSVSPLVSSSSEPTVSGRPSIPPTLNPSRTHNPSISPTVSPSGSPTLAPSKSPTYHPSVRPPNIRSSNPTLSPSGQPTSEPSITPTESSFPSYRPTSTPSKSEKPSINPTATPSKSTKPSLSPTGLPSKSPTFIPSLVPTLPPSAFPTSEPSPSPSDSNNPTSHPSLLPTESLRPSINPTTNPSRSTLPSLSPTMSPSESPTLIPTESPSMLPTASPSRAPSSIPSTTPTVCSVDSDCDDGDPCTTNVCVEGGICKSTNLVKVGINISHDSYPGETSWTLKNNCNGKTVASNNMNKRSGTDGFICIADDEYTFTIEDAWGDGICCDFGSGSYTVSYEEKVVASGASFGTSESTTFGSCLERTYVPIISPSQVPTVTPTTNRPTTSKRPSARPSIVPSFGPSAAPAECIVDSDCYNGDPCTRNICAKEGTCLFFDEGLVKIDVRITLDRYPGETSWTIKNMCNDERIVASNNMNKRDGTDGVLCLPNDEYKFTINDSWGDGICCQFSDGSYTVLYEGEVVASGGSFGSSESSTFGHCRDTLSTTSPSSSPTTRNPKENRAPSIAEDEWLAPAPSRIPSSTQPLYPSETKSRPNGAPPVADLIATNFILEYDFIPEVNERREPHRQEHMDLLTAFLDQKQCLTWGFVRNPYHSRGDHTTSTILGAKFIFADVESARVFVALDPYVENGIVTDYSISEWDLFV